MTKIKKLTPEQASKLATYRDEWLKIGLSTERADRPRAEAGVKLAYEAAGLAPPKLIIWLDSPLAGAIGAAMLAGTAKAGKNVRAQVGDQVRDQVWAQVGDQVGDQVWDQVWAQVGAQVGAQVRDQVYRAAYGQHDANWLAFYSFFREQCDPALADKLRGMDEVARSCGWWWPFTNAVILTERPTEVHRDDRGGLHNRDGAALLYPDGWGIYAINGLRLAEQVIKAPETLTFEQVRDEPNAEIRRHMLDRFGGLRGADAQAAWISAGGLKPISREDISSKMQPSGLSIWRLSHGDKPVTCDLYHAPIEDDEDLAILMVVCTSTAKAVPLRVPPTIRDAAQARAWTFGVDLKEAVET